MLTTMALVASLALSAQAVSSKRYLSETNVKTSRWSQSPRHDGRSRGTDLMQPTNSMTEPQKTPSDLVTGLENFESLWFNQFDVIPGAKASHQSKSVGARLISRTPSWMAHR